ncbi:MAG: sulfite exporter TauE/SafE family protein [Burkholderiales bacterium]|nr:sulfite exporter TauE/SafE family protein [Burkholderiales bacterium]
MTIIEGVSLTAAFLMGLSMGAHCLSMCGGFVAALAGDSKESVVRLVKKKDRAQVSRAFTAILAAQFGRMTTYLLLGAVFGALGSVIAAYMLSAQRILATLAALMLLWIAYSIARKEVSLAKLEAVGLKLYSLIFSKFSSNIRENTVISRYFLGLLWGFTPCGMVYSMLGLAMVTGNAGKGAVIMLAFGLGTLPNLFVAGVIFNEIKRFAQNTLVRYAVAMVIAGFALWSLNQLWLTDKMDRLFSRVTTAAESPESAMPPAHMHGMPPSEPPKADDKDMPQSGGHHHH